MRIITLPPAQMVQNMKVGQMDACCMVEPWGTRGVQLNVSYIAFYGNDLWPDHPVKGFAFMEPFANKNPRTVRAILAALHESGIYCDKMEHRPQVAKDVSVTEYLAAPVDSILPSMLGHYDYGLGKG